MKLLDFSHYARHPLGRVYDLIIQRGREKKAATVPSSEGSCMTRISSTKIEPPRQPTNLPSLDQSTK